MSSGFNTNVRVGDQVYHVQTEDRGPQHPRIDTAIYCGGRVLRRVSTSYADAVAAAPLPEGDVRRRVEEQHRSVVQAIQAGTLAFGEAPAAPGGLLIRLRNADSWVSSGQATLDIEVLSRKDSLPQPGAHVEIMLKGAALPARWKGACNADGRFHVSFPLPPLDYNSASLLIRASSAEGKGALRFAVRSKTRASLQASSEQKP